MNSFVDGYNHHHRHTGIGLHTPADVHYGLASARNAEREATLAAARERHPERFGSGSSPKIINLPEAAWINQPPQQAAASVSTPDGPNHLDKLRVDERSAVERIRERGRRLLLLYICDAQPCVHQPDQDLCCDG